MPVSQLSAPPSASSTQIIPASIQITHAQTYVFAPQARFTRNVESGVPLVYLGDKRVLQLSEPLGQVCDALATAPVPQNSATLAARLVTPAWDPARVAKALQALAAAGVVGPAAPQSAPSAPPPRVEFRRPFTIRFALADPTRLCLRLVPLAGPLRGRSGLVLSLLGAVVQAMVWVGTDQAHGLSLVPSGGSLAVALTLALLAVVCALHELAHAVVLTAAGGRPGRVGVMLFYLAPALFCDVGDSFRLDRRAQVHVAMAGVAFQCQAGAVLAPLALVPGPVGVAVGHFLVLNLALVVFNLMPFIALDGYFALRASVGVPNLREVAMAAWTRRVRALLPCGRSARVPHPSLPRWTSVYGMAASAAPMLLFATGLGVWAARFGWHVTAAWTPVVVLVVVAVWLHNACRQCRSGAASGRPRYRSTGSADASSHHS